MMMIAAARALKDGDVCFVGIGLPSAACNLARLTHAPNLTLIYESGTIATKPDVLPLSIGDGELSETALCTVSVPEMFRYWLQGGRIGVGFLGGAPRRRLGLTTLGPTLLTTDLCQMRPDPDSKELTVTALHPGVTREQVTDATGWRVRFAEDVAETQAPTAEELQVLRALQART